MKAIRERLSPQLINQQIKTASDELGKLRDERSELNSLATSEKNEDVSNPALKFNALTARLLEILKNASKFRTVKDFLEDYWISFIEDQRPKIDHEAVAQNIRDVQQYFQQRKDLSGRTIGANEKALIDEIEMAIASYWTETDDQNYYRIKRAVAKYNAWLDKRLLNRERYIAFLIRLKCRVLALIDIRMLIRSILRFRLRTLSSKEDMTDVNSLFTRQIVQHSMSSQNEYRKYQTYI